MKYSRCLALLAASVAIVLGGCAQNTPAPSAAASTDDAAIKAVNIAWNNAYNAGDGAAVAALYDDDAVLSAPGAAALRGKAAISGYYAKDAQEFAASGGTVTDGEASDVGQSGDLAWQWGTYRITNKSGAVADSGKFLTVVARRGGKWLIIRDIWNSDHAPASATPQ